MADIPINPSALVTNGALVSASNPLPIELATAGAPATEVTLNPRVFVVDGAIVSTSNPLPLQIV